MSQEKKDKTFYIIDGFAQIFRAYYAVRSLNSPVTNEPTNATFGFVGMLMKLWREQQPDYVVVALDVGGDKGTIRLDIDPQYKANREPPPEDMAPQVDRIKEILEMMKIPLIFMERYEADDVIATLCEQVKDQKDLKVRIVSKDKDLQQLLSDHVEMFDAHKDIFITEQDLMNDKGITPAQVVDMLALMGDNADNIPGAVGVGPKTAAKLIAKYNTIDNLYQHLDELKGKQKERVAEAEERVRFNLQLVNLYKELPLDFDLEQARVQPWDMDRLEPLFKDLGFNRHLVDLRMMAAGSELAIESQGGVTRAQAADGGPGLFDMIDQGSEKTETTYEQANPDNYRCLTTKSELSMYLRAVKMHCQTGEPIAIDTETTDPRPRHARLCGVSISMRAEEGVYIPIKAPEGENCLDEAIAIELLKPVLEDEEIGKVGQNLKYDMIVLRQHGIALNGVVFDTMIGGFLYDASRSSYGMDAMAMHYLNYEPIHFEELVGKGKKQKTFDQVSLDKATTYAAEDTDLTYRLFEYFKPRLKSMGLNALNESLELPLSHVLAEMEYNGIQASSEELERQKEELKQRIGELRNAIFEAAGEEFNVDSTKQLAEVLFNKLGCKVIRRGKTGPSTNAEVLDRIANEQEAPGSVVAEKVLAYRELTKLVNTYMDGLKHAIHDETGRIHASFHQTGAATGRLSSSDPNLQNIPIRRASGREIRKAFSAVQGHVLLSADYSQVELRMLAHLADEEGLKKAFSDGLDIHTAVAAEVFNVSLDEVDSEQRSAAKMVNFGIVYGISAYGLARRLGTSADAGSDVQKAAQIIDDYKARYPRISAFLNECVSQAQTEGYVKTIMGRRRPIPQIHSRNGNMRKMGERMAINTVVQGSAADLIKKAFIDLYSDIQKQQRPLKMLLQIHDELVFETPEDGVEDQAKYVEKMMSQAMDLSVPLLVDAHWGHDWYDAK